MKPFLWLSSMWVSPFESTIAIFDIFWNTLPSSALRVLLWFWWEGRKNWNVRNLDLTSFGKTWGRYTKPNIDLQKKIFEKSQTVRLGGGGVRCHSTICEIAGFSHGFRSFSIVSPYDSCSGRLPTSKTPTPSFWSTIYSVTTNISLCMALGAKLKNTVISAQCHFSRAGSTGTDWNFRI